MKIEKPNRIIRFQKTLLLTGLFLAVQISSQPSRAEEAIVAVASNFAEPLQKLKLAFENTSPHRISISIGSSGKLYAQIINGAPFDIFLSADQARPILLENAQKTVAASRFTYATGRLALWGVNPIGDVKKQLLSKNFATLAIANPKLAPYGRAAREVLVSLGVWESLTGKIVEGENIGQTFSYVSTGNAQLGLVALSYVLSPRNMVAGNRWDVPVDLYQPIRQDGVLIAGADRNPAAIAFFDFLKSPTARTMISSFGYGLE